MRIFPQSWNLELKAKELEQDLKARAELKSIFESIDEKDREELELALKDYCILLSTTKQIDFSEEALADNQVREFKEWWEAVPSLPEMTSWLGRLDLSHKVIAEWNLAFLKAQAMSIERKQAPPNRLTNEEVRELQNPDSFLTESAEAGESP